jgi:hypothetical protein
MSGTVVREDGCSVMAQRTLQGACQAIGWDVGRDEN